jgi:hypothetical protein
LQILFGDTLHKISEFLTQDPGIFAIWIVLLLLIRAYHQGLIPQEENQMQAPTTIITLKQA